MFSKRVVLLMIALLVTSLVLGLGSAPGSAAKASGRPISFRGNIVEFYEDTEFVNGNFYYVMNFRAEVETNSSNFELSYRGWEPPATPASDWRQYHGYVEKSTWDFDADHKFEATGQMTGVQWFVFPPSLDSGTPTRGRIVYVFDITEGEWGEDQAVVGGRASINFSMDKDEYFEAGCPKDNPCNQTVSGTIKGTFLTD